MTEDVKTLVERREEIARIIEPFAWKWLNVPGQAHAYANLRERSLAKADAILSSLVGVGGSSCANLGGEGPDGPFAGEASCQSEGATETPHSAGREVDLAALIDLIRDANPQLPHEMARLNGEIDALVDNENEAWPPNYTGRVDTLQALARRLGLDERALSAATLVDGETDPRPLSLLYAAAMVRRLIERHGQTFVPEAAPRPRITFSSRAPSRGSERSDEGNLPPDEHASTITDAHVSCDARLAAAIEQAAVWFEEYADHHQAKGALDKASRNLERANFLRRALPSTSEPLTVLEGEKGSSRELAQGPEPLTVPDAARHADGAGWQAIDSAPRDTDVLLYCPHLATSNPERIELGHAVSTHGREQGWSYHSWATHWRPLPEPPAASPLSSVRLP